MNTLKKEIFMFLILITCIIVMSKVYDQISIKIHNANWEHIKMEKHSIELLDDRIELKYINNLLSDEDCNYLINSSQGYFKNSQVVSDNGTSTLSYERTSQSYVVNEDDENIKLIKNKIYDFLSNNVDSNKNWDNYTEGTQIVKYETGQEYKAHYDYFTEDYLKKNNEPQREYTMFIYLNDVDGNGGETYFPNLNKKIKPKKGAALFWRNCLESNKCFTNSLHQGLPPYSGKKYGMNVWIRFDEI